MSQNKTTEKNTCETCGHYLRHYIWCRRYTPIFTGHCVHFSRPKSRRPWQDACEGWTPQDEKYRRDHCPPKSRKALP